jgi:hypothetical protein
VIPFPFNSEPAEADAKLNGEGGLSHSEIAGSKPAHGSPTLIAACHVLHRLYMPRHSPNALTSRLRVHTTNDNTGRQNQSSSTTRRVLPWLTVWYLYAQPDNKLNYLVTISTNVIITITLAVILPRHRLKTHSQCQRGAKCSISRPKSETDVFIPGGKITSIA